MMENNIVSWITGKTNLKQVPLTELKEITHNYPYFTLAQLLLTVKMKEEDSPEYPQQLQKTALNFQNPQWLHFQLESLEQSLKEHASEETTVETMEPSTEMSENLWDATQAQATYESDLQEELSITEEDETTDTQSFSKEIPLQPIAPEQEKDSTSEEDTTIEPGDKKEDTHTPSRLSAMLEAQAIAFKTAEAPKEKLAFDSPALLHTKDYFASIGITADNTLNTDFGHKVKRFSDWLKQMKSIGVQGIDKQIDPKEDKIISQKADDSNKSAAILTEAMVDVLVQQGKKEEAVEILEKLSLLKPEKSSYFASLIHNLKNNN